MFDFKDFLLPLSFLVSVAIIGCPADAQNARELIYKTGITEDLEIRQRFVEDVSSDYIDTECEEVGYKIMRLECENEERDEEEN